MRLDAVSSTQQIQNPEVSGKEIKFSEGDVVQAHVISVREDGTASLRTADGILLNARLEAGVELLPGADVYLQVQEGGAVAIMSKADSADFIPADGSVRHASDALTQAVATRLTELGYKPEPGMVATMKNLLTEFPEMKIDEAAFLAANKLPAEPAIREALSSVLSGETDTASMLDALGKLVNETAGLKPETAQPQQIPQSEPAAVQTQEPQIPQSEPAAVQTQEPQITQSESVAVQTQEPQITQSEPAAVQTQEPQITQSEPAAVQTQEPQITQSEPVAVPPETGSKALGELEAALAKARMVPEAPESAAEAVPANTGEPALKTALPEFGRWLADALGTKTPEGPGKLFTGENLANSPLLEGLSARSLAGMADSLNRIAASMPETGTEAELFEGLSKFAENMFLRLDDESGAEKLREVREELYVKLAYFHDAVSASGSPSKTVVMEQTQKLMDHVRLLSSLDQFVCVQIPVQIGDDRRNADLYICKKDRGGTKRIDPEDVKILLALDLEHMGNLEALIEVKMRDVSLRFEVESEEIASNFRQNTTKLHKMLDDLGYKFANSSVTAKKRGTTVETALLTMLETERSGGRFSVVV